jgi:lysozyme
MTNRLLIWAILEIAVGVSFGAARATAQTDSPDSSWKAITEGLSRDELFKQFADDTAKEHTGDSQAFALPYDFNFPNSALQDIDGSSRVDEKFGIDISQYQGTTVPFDKLNGQHVYFVYTRCSRGVKAFDPTFRHNWEALRAAGVRRGAYHFLSSDPSQSGTQQADSFVSFLKFSGGLVDGDLRPAVDLEWDVACQGCPDRWTVNKRTPQEILNTTVDFITRVHVLTGWTPIIYTNKSFLRDHKIVTPSDLSHLRSGGNGSLIWIFDIQPPDLKMEIPDPKQNLDYKLWQFSWAGHLNSGTGYFHAIDTDVFKGTDSDFTNTFVSKN